MNGEKSTGLEGRWGCSTGHPKPAATDEVGSQFGALKQAPIPHGQKGAGRFPYILARSGQSRFATAPIDSALALLRPLHLRG